jgi:hypothetical protein
VRSTLDELTQELKELRALVASIEPVNSALKDNQDPLVRDYMMIRRRFDYAAFVVALYAAFERFIENLIASYARLEARRVPYAGLPAKLANKHLSRTAEILLRGRLGEGRYAGLRDVDIVKNLFNCLNGDIPYALNEAAVVAHDSNLRVPEIDKLFAELDVDNKICSHARRADALLDWYCKSKELADSPPDGVPMTTIEERLKDIVDRRNQVAHRGGNPDNRLGPEQMSDAIGFIEAFSNSIFAIVVGRYLQGHHAVPDQGFQLQQRQDDGPYQKGTVVVVEKPAQRLFVGQPVFVVLGPAGARWGRIRTLKLDDAFVEAVEPDDDAPKGIGIRLSFRCPKGAALVALAADDDVVWYPE